MARLLFVLIASLLLVPVHALADTINACVKQSNGKLRVVADPAQCKPNEGAISWDTEGPPGAEGQQGPQGPQGDPAPAPPTFKLVGWTTGTYQGNLGILAYTEQCQLEFPGSRFCKAPEVMDMVDLPEITPASSPFAWVRSGGIGTSQGNDCDGWRSSDGPGGDTGLRIRVDGRIHQEACDGFYHVACCAPAP